MNPEYLSYLLLGLSSYPAVWLFIFGLLIFVISLKIARGPLRDYNNREIRRALTITITVIYIGLLSLALSGRLEINDASLSLIDGINKAFMVAIAFYFGSRAVEEGIKMYKEK